MSGSTSNPLIAQGNLNRIRANIQVVGFPALNISPSFLGKGAITFTRGGSATTMIDQLVGRVASPEPYQPVDFEIHLNKAQGLAALWEAQMLALSLIGTLNFYTDASTLPVYQILQTTILNVGPISTNGTSSDYMLSLTGTYPINNSLWALVI